MKQSPNITRKVVFFRWKFCAPDLEASENKPHQICRIAGRGTFQNVSSASVANSSPISTLMQPVSLEIQNMKVVELFLDRSLDERVMPKLRSNVKAVQNRPISYVLHLTPPFAS